MGLILMSNKSAKATQFNNLLNLLIKNGITDKQYDIIVKKLSIEITENPSNFLHPYAFEFVNNVRDVHEGEHNSVVLFYPLVMNVLLHYIDKIKIKDRECDTSTPLTEIVVNFSELVGVGIELLGDMCDHDSYFKKFLAYENKECIPEATPKRVKKEYFVELVNDIFDW